MLSSTSGFSKPVSLTKNGQENYKTVCGGLTTIIIFFILVGYLVILLTTPFVKDSISTTVTPATGTLDCTSTGGGGTTVPVGHVYVCETVTTCPVNGPALCSPVTGTLSTLDAVPFVQYSKAQEIQTYIPAYNDTAVHSPFANGFQIAFKWRAGIIDPNMFSVDVFKISSSDGGVTITPTQMNLVACTTAMFPSQISAELTLLTISDYLCIDPIDLATFTFQQNKHGQNYSYFTFQVSS